MEPINKLLVICGPTATGKTALAAQLASAYNGELVSADSRQVYRGMDLTTGKDRPGVPTWLYDVVDPDEEFSVSHWIKRARAAIADIVRRGKLPIIVGGTGLYIKAILDCPDTIDIPPNKTLRETLQHASVRELQQMVARGSMNDSDWNNPRRLIRKIEIIKSGNYIKKKKQLFDSFIIGLTAPLPELDARIDVRFKKRMEQGIQNEIDALVKTYDAALPSMSVIGLNEHAYARRQLTWFRKQQNVHWFDVTSGTVFTDVRSLVDAWYT